MRKLLLSLLLGAVSSFSAQTIYQGNSIGVDEVDSLDAELSSGDTLLIQTTGDTLWIEESIEFSTDGATIILDADPDTSGYGILLKNVRDSILLSGTNMTFSVRYSDTLGYYSDSMLVLVDSVSADSATIATNYIESIDTIDNGTDTTYDTAYYAAYDRMILIDTILTNNNKIELLQYASSLENLDSLSAALTAGASPLREGLGQGVILAPATYNFATAVNTHAIVGADVATSTTSQSFQGIFEGNGQTISGLNFSGDDSKNEMGFFASLYNAEVRNMTLIAGINGGARLIGCLAAKSTSSHVSDIVVKGSIFSSYTATTGYIAGLIGSSNGDILDQLTNEAAVATTVSAGSSFRVGGLVAQAANITMNNLTNTGAITNNSTGAYVAGIVGDIQSMADHGSSFINTGVLSTDSSTNYLAGGFGRLISTKKISNVKNVGDVNGQRTGSLTTYAAGVAAYCSPCVLDDVVNYGDVTGHYAGGVLGYMTHADSWIKQAHNYGDIYGGLEAGGVGGYANAGEMRLSTNHGNINHNGSFDCGGVLGWGTNMVIDAILNTGDVVSTNAMGGGAGGIMGYGSASISNAFNSGDVSSTTAARIGGLAGSFSTGTTFTFSTSISVGSVYTTSTIGGAGAVDYPGANVSQIYYDSTAAPSPSTTFSTANGFPVDSILNPNASLFKSWDAADWLLGDGEVMYPGVIGFRKTGDVTYQKLIATVYTKQDTNDITLNLYQNLPIYTEGWTYDAESLDSGFTLTLTDSILLLEQNYNYNSTDTIIISATHDESQVVVSDTLFIAVDEPINTIPQRDVVLKDTVIRLGAPDLSFYLGSIYSDVDGDSLSWQVEFRAKDNAVQYNEVDSVNFVLNGQQSGSDTVLITLTDTKDGYILKDTLLVYVKSAPYALKTTVLSDTVLTGYEPIAVYLGDVFTDIDVGDSLIYSASGEDLCSLNVVGDTLFIIDNDSIGEDEITVTATDPWNLSATSSIDLVIKSIPVAQDSIADTLILASDSIAYDILGFFLDADGDAITLSVSADSGLSAKIDRDYLILEGDGSSIGDKEVTLTATDEDSNAVDYSFTVTMNLAPSFPKELSEINVLGLTTLDLSEYFSDADLIIYSVEGEDESCISTVIDESTLILRGSVSATEECSNTVSIVATDAANYSSSQDLVINLKFSEPDTSDSAGTNIEYTGNATALELSQANDILIVNNLQSGKMMNYAIYNMQGVVEMQGTQRAMSTSLEINLTELNSGVHYIVIRQGASGLREKLTH